MADKKPVKKTLGKKDMKKTKGGAMAAMNMQFSRPVLGCPPDPIKVKIGEAAPPDPI